MCWPLIVTINLTQTIQAKVMSKFLILHMLIMKVITLDGLITPQGNISPMLFVTIFMFMSGL